MFINVIVRPRSGALGASDTQAFGVADKPINPTLYARDQSRGANDVQVRASRLWWPGADAPPPGFPTQFAGLQIRKTGDLIELCLVAEADAPAGMGGVVKLDKNGTVYALYLVETGDTNASPVRVRTTTGTKSVRLKT